METKRRLMAMVDQNREMILSFIQEMVRCRSPNPPGDTRSTARMITDFLSSHGHPFEEISGHPEMPNILASTRFSERGRHLLLNGHLDVFPVENNSGWTQEPWGGVRTDGKIFGRGVSDMKVGSVASLFAYHYLARLEEPLNGKLTLALVSDEETFGPWGARYLFDNHREKVIGDCVLIGEPSSKHTVRFGEKGFMWTRFTVKTKGAHGAYTHASENAILVASQLSQELVKLSEMRPPEADNLSASLDKAGPALDNAYGVGAGRNVRRVTVNIGMIRGGAKINMVASDCSFDVDFRIPNGFTDQTIDLAISEVLSRFPQASAERLHYNAPNWSAPDHEMIQLVRSNAREIFGMEPTPVVGLAGTDARLWRYNDVPAAVFGPAPNGMGSFDEYVAEDEAINVLKVHLGCAYEYLRVSTA